jgi:hypothetical protein
LSDKHEEFEPKEETKHKIPANAQEENGKLAEQKIYGHSVQGGRVLMMRRKRDGDSTTKTTHKHETAGWSRSGGTWCELSQIMQCSLCEHERKGKGYLIISTD